SRPHLFSAGTDLRQSGGGSFLWSARLSHRSIDQAGGLQAVAAVVGRGTAKEIVDPPPERRRAAEILFSERSAFVAGEIQRRSRSARRRARGSNSAGQFAEAKRVRGARLYRVGGVENADAERRATPLERSPGRLCGE